MLNSTYLNAMDCGLEAGVIEQTLLLISHGPTLLKYLVLSSVIPLLLNNNGNCRCQKSHTLSSWSSRPLSLTGKITVLNNLVLSRLWYLLSVFVLPDAILTKINHLSTAFIWNNKPPLVARTTLELPRHQGGFGLCSISLKIASLHVMWIKRMVTPEVGKWSFFLNHHLRRAFLAEPVIRVFGFNAQSSATLRHLPSFYRSVLSAWYRVGGCRKQDGTMAVHPTHLASPIEMKDFTAAKAYQILTTKELPPPNCVTKFPWVNWSATWDSIHLCKYICSTLDTVWKIAHGVLPTADRLVRFGMDIPISCFCGHPETLDHLFFHCPLASRLWFWFSTMAHHYRTDFPRLTNTVIRFGFPRSAAVPKGFQILSHIIKHQLWNHRNRVRFDSTGISSKTVLESVKNQFRFTLRIQKKHTSSSFFYASWLAMGTFGFITPEQNLIFSAQLAIDPG